jgi:hypothetical protein
MKKADPSKSAFMDLCFFERFLSRLESFGKACSRDVKCDPRL